jgi:GT2 family glycosyltransferase
MTKVSIVVPTCRRPETLRTTLQALLAVDHPSSALELIVVDNADDPATSAVVEHLPEGPVRIELLRQCRGGAAAARNAGARSATGDVLLFCDDDMVVTSEHVKLHLATRETYGDVLVGSERWYSPEALRAFEATPFGRFRVKLERDFRAALRERPLNGGCVETPTLASCDLSVDRETFWRLGGFDEQFPYAGAEDQDLSLRATKAGYRLIRNLDIRSLHNDPTVTLRQFCERERRGAHTVLPLVRKHPETLGDFSRNGPLSRGDSATLAASKLVKSLLSGERQLGAVRALVRLLERMPLSDKTLQAAYRRVIGLYIFRGYREALSAGERPPGRA